MEHPCELAECIGTLFLDEETSDVTLIVEKERLPAHKCILIASCEYFRALFLGDTKVSPQNVIVLENVTLRGFKMLLNFMYTGQLKLDLRDAEVIPELLDVVRVCRCEKLKTSLCRYLMEMLTIENVCAMLSRAHSLRFGDLISECSRLILENPCSILKSEQFNELSEAALCHILSEDTFYVEEIKILDAVRRWIAMHPEVTDLSNVLRTIRLPLIQSKDLTTTVKESGLFSADVLMDVLQKRETGFEDPKYRIYPGKDVNFADKSFGASRLIRSQVGMDDANRIGSGYDSDYLPAIHVLSEAIVVALRAPFRVNHIAFTLNGHSAYFISVSMDLVKWSVVIDHSAYMCYSRQNLYFEPRVARYIRIESLNTEDRVQMSALKVTLTTKPFKLIHGFYAPEENVASTGLVARVNDGTHNVPGMMREDNTDEAKSRWIWHPIGKGSITIQLPQPLTVDSMRLLLRSDESQSYRYYIETSIDHRNWTRVVDRTDDYYRSWQHLSFKALPVFFIRIVGKASWRAEVFSCARFECPSSEKTTPRCDSPPLGVLENPFDGVNFDNGHNLDAAPWIFP